MYIEAMENYINIYRKNQNNNNSLKIHISAKRFLPLCQIVL